MTEIERLKKIIEVKDIKICLLENINKELTKKIEFLSKRPMNEKLQKAEETIAFLNDKIVELKARLEESESYVKEAKLKVTHNSVYGNQYEQ